MRLNESLHYTFGQINDTLAGVLDGLDAEAVAWRPDPAANSIAWLAWHLTRVEDTHIAEMADRDQVWDEQWAQRLDLPADYDNHGYGDSPEDVARIRPPDAGVLLEYNRATTDMVTAFLAMVSEADFDRIVDERWDPPVTMGVRFTSVIGDAYQHVGQAAYLRGLYERR